MLQKIRTWILKGAIEQDGWKRRIVEAIAKWEVNKFMDGKKWYQSKAVWTAITGAILGGIQPISTAFGHPITVPAWVYETLGAFGLYAVRDSIGKPLV